MKLNSVLKVFFLFVLLALSCTDTNEELNKNFSINLKNESFTTFTLEGWRASEIIIEETVLAGSLNTISYSSINFLGLFGTIDSLVVTFENNKGYICTGELSDNLCFENRNAFDNEGFVNLGNNVYEFIITQEDFDNAYDLP